MNSWFRFFDVMNMLMAAEYGCSSFSDISCILTCKAIYDVFYDLCRFATKILTESNKFLFGQKASSYFVVDSVTVNFFHWFFPFLDSFDFLSNY